MQVKQSVNGKLQTPFLRYLLRTIFVPVAHSVMWSKTHFLPIRYKILKGGSLHWVPLGKPCCCSPGSVYWSAGPPAPPPALCLPSPKLSSPHAPPGGCAAGTQIYRSLLEAKPKETSRQTDKETDFLRSSSNQDFCALGTKSWRSMWHASWNICPAFLTFELWTINNTVNGGVLYIHTVWVHLEVQYPLR